MLCEKSSYSGSTKVRAMPRRQGAKPYGAALWRNPVTSARKKEKKAMPPWPNGDSEGATARC